MLINLQLDYTITISWNNKDKVFCVSCMEIPACTVTDEDEETALLKVKDAIVNHLDYLAKRGRNAPLPVRI